MKVLACSKVRMVPVLGYDVVELAVKGPRHTYLFCGHFRIS